MTDNPYAKILKHNLGRLINIYNMDSHSPLYGCGDRQYWSWKIKDFPNATFQGGIHALALALDTGVYTDKLVVLELYKAALQSMAGVIAKNGSVSEAFPNEHSFCVTALVAFDLLSGMDVIDGDLETSAKKEYLQRIAPMIDFITSNNETHAVISNHLATAAAAVALWNKHSGEKNSRADKLLDVIIRHQSKEGWYREYEGADPGYQTLCTYYLSALYRTNRQERLRDSLIRSARFLVHFIHPDGSIGGVYGSRNTEVYYPGGLVELSSLSEEFSILASELEKGIRSGNHVLPQDIDPENFIPLLNSYAYAAAAFTRTQTTETPEPHWRNNYEKNFADAGLMIKCTNKYQAFVNYKKGGTLTIYDKDNKTLDTVNSGLFGTLSDGTRFSTQVYNRKPDFKDYRVKTGFYRIQDRMPNPVSTIILRFMSITVFRSLFFTELFKKFIVKLLITGKKRLKGYAVRQFKFSEDKITVYERVKPPTGTITIDQASKSFSIHMASSGYNRHTGINPEHLVEFIRKDHTGKE